MNIIDDLNTNILVDEINSDIDQSELNLDLLIDHDRLELFNSLHYRINESYLKFLLNSTDKLDVEYWRDISKEISKVYSLNYIKVYMDMEFDVNIFVTNIIKLLFYLKIKLISYIEYGKIKYEITRDEFEELLINDNAPKLFLLVIKYIDRDSFNKFKIRIFKEITLDFIE